ncbi:HD domain-containing protein [Glycomyces arizonensis]|uniref:HD domain-containing protein n=1 Tax=Glycomyces arizonensis TaxID=256035 RepID=UPI001B7FD454|nr:HD domain-containing protein [Glycomyces arizonensis]
MPDGVAGPVPTNVVGLGEVFTDPLWRVPVRLSPVEVDLLRTEPVRRLHFVAHGGASAVSTLQSYSRLEHTLGVLSLVAHFRAEDELLRVAALLHDIGHLPLSHTLEGIAGLDHHRIGVRLLHADPLREVLRRHGIRADDVAAVLDGRSPLTGRAGLLNLDHLDSFVRSGRSAGRLDADPVALLGRLGIEGDAVTADRAAAEVLVGLVRAEARLHTSWDNVGPISVVRRLGRRLLDEEALAPDRLARMTDPQLWAAFESCSATREESAMVRYEPHRLHVAVAADRSSGWDFALRKIYSSAPLVDGEPIGAAAPHLAAELRSLQLLPTEFRVWWD